jgi:hypothetical protein
MCSHVGTILSISFKKIGTRFTNTPYFSFFTAGKTIHFITMNSVIMTFNSVSSEVSWTCTTFWTGSGIGTNYVFKTVPIDTRNWLTIPAVPSHTNRTLFALSSAIFGLDTGHIFPTRRILATDLYASYTIAIKTLKIIIKLFKLIINQN